VQFHCWALSHGVTAEDGTHAAEHWIYVADLDEESPQRGLRLGFDNADRLLESVVLRFDSGNELLIHAMKARPQYIDLITRLDERRSPRPHPQRDVLARVPKVRVRG
jgi:hypothetical protein